MSIAYLALGSNLNSPTLQVERAIDNLHKHSALRLLATSSLYQTKPYGVIDQPDFINGVVKIETKVLPLELLGICQQIESEHNRQRVVRWGPRTLDIDILLYDDIALHTPDLTLPHPGLLIREFVLLPLADIAPELILSNGHTVSHHLNQIKNRQETLV